MVDVAEGGPRRSSRQSPRGTTRVFTRKRKKKSDTDGQDKGGGKETQTNVVGACRSLNMATTSTNNTAQAPRDGAKRSASVTTVMTTNNTTAIETVPKGQPNKGSKAVA